MVSKSEKKEAKTKLTGKKKLVFSQSSSPEVFSKITEILSECNKKDYGKEVDFQFLVEFLMANKFTDKDIEKIQKSSLTAKEKIENAFKDYVLKNGEKISFDEFICRELKLA